MESGIFNNLSGLIGNTPMVRLNSLKWGIEGSILLKMESCNPGGSVKDRLALALVCEAYKNGLVSDDSVIIEPSSGNTGVGLAMVAAACGLRAIITMPEHMSKERRRLIKAFGGEVIVTPKSSGMQGAIHKAHEIASDTKNSFIPMQFENPETPAIHKKTTAPEIWDATSGKIDAFVAGVGTGGTITGVGEFLKKQNKQISIHAVEPTESPVLSGGTPAPHNIQGIGAGFVPPILNTRIYDEIIQVSEKEATFVTRKLAEYEGILCGISSGANVFAAISYLKRKGNSGNTVVTIICDTGERYLSTELFNKI